MLWLRSPLVAGAELEESPVSYIPKCPVCLDTSFLLTWHCCRPRMLRVSLNLVPRKKHFHPLWWSSGGPFLSPPVGSCSGGSCLHTPTCPQVFWGKVDVSYFWWWTGRITHLMMMVTSVFVLTEFLYFSLLSPEKGHVL